MDQTLPTESVSDSKKPDATFARIPMTYRPDIDGLRAVAVLSVLLCHAGLGVPGGYVGVDVFFVISGYLITALLVRDLELSQFSIVDFWERRVRRIFPALSVVTLATVAMGAVILYSVDFEALGRSLVALVMIVSNLYFLANGGYFDGVAKEKALLHTWSLAIEEQFYLFLPVGLYLFYRFLPHRWQKKKLIATLLVIALMSLLVSMREIYHGRVIGAYFLLPTRAWEMLLGALLALLPTTAFPVKRWLREASACLGLGMIIAAAMLYTPETLFPGLAALPPCLGAALLIWSNTPVAGLPQGQGSTTLCGYFLSLKPMVAIGLISYSLYLWHWPLFAYSSYLSINFLEARLALLLASLILAVLSWKYVETPVRTRRVFGSRRSLFTFFVLASAGFSILGGLIVTQKGLPVRFSGKTAENDAMLLQNRKAHERGDLNGRMEVTFSRVLEKTRKGEFQAIGEEGKAATFMLWGDSHANVAFPAVDTVLKEAGLAGLAMIQGGMPPLLDMPGHTYKRSSEVAAEVVKFLEKHPELRDVLLICRWSNYNRERFADSYRKTIEHLEKGGRRVWVLKQPPEAKANVARMIRWKVHPRLWAPTLEYHREHNREVEKAFANDQRSSFIDLLPIFVVAGSNYLTTTKDGVLLYTDRDHLSYQGALQIILPALRESLLPALKARTAREELSAPTLH